MKSMFSDASIQSMFEMIEQLRSSGLDREGLKQEVAVRLVGIALEPPVAHQPTFTTLMTALPVLAASRSTEATADEIQDMRKDAAIEGFKPVVTALGDSIIELGTLGGLEAGLVDGMVGRVSLAMAVGLPTDPETLTRR